MKGLLQITATDSGGCMAQAQLLAGIFHLRKVPAWASQRCRCEGLPGVQGLFTERTTFKGQRYDPGECASSATLPPYDRRPA